jgi:hypothetical protein
MLHLCRVQALTISLLLAAGVANAQKNNPQYDNRKLHFGFTLAYNSSIFKPTFNSNLQLLPDSLQTITPRSAPGFGLGVVSSLALSKHMDLRFIPSLHFSSKNIDYKFQGRRAIVTKTVESAYVDFPLLLKLKSDRLNNFRLYVVGGGKYSIDMSSQAKVQDDLERVKTTRTDYSVEYGVGADFYLPYFKFSPEIKIAQGLTNVLVPESHRFVSSLDGLRSKTFYISLLFE